MPVAAGTAFIVLDDGTLMKAPPSVPPPAPAPAPPPVQLPPATSPAPIDPGLLAAAGVTQAQVDAANAAAAAAAAGAAVLLAGGGSEAIAAAEQNAGASQDVIDALLALGIPDLSNVLTTTDTGSGGDVGDTGDLDESERIADANQPDLSTLAALTVLDVTAPTFLSTSSGPLKGGGAITAIAQACADYGVDPLAAIADALHEGAGGGIGDNGNSYGPFQLNINGLLPEPYRSRGRNNAATNAWAWTENGIRYAVRAMCTSSPSAKGLHGHPAVYAIVYGMERPADKPGQYKIRAAEYDKLVGLGKGWPAYAADRFAGPAGGGGVDTTPITGSDAAPYKPANVVANWRDFVDVFKLTVPQAHAKVKSQADDLVEVFR